MAGVMDDRRPQRVGPSWKRVLATLVVAVAAYVALIAVKAPGTCSAPGGGPCGTSVASGSLAGLESTTTRFPVAGNGVRATLTGPITTNARPGSRINITWTFDHHFGGQGVFVRLLSASGRRPEAAFAHGADSHYAATVRVPQGGIARIEIGIEGTTSGAGGSRPAPVLFPITNTPPVTRFRTAP
jgi:hypothetical protein